MSTFQKISSSLFTGAAYMALTIAGWKKETVNANIDYVSHGTWNKLAELEQNNSFYKQIIKNLTRHVGELLFDFEIYKKLPENCNAYPYTIGNKIFELGAGAAPVIERMRQGGIFLTAHYGNYEASGAWLCALGAPLKASFIPLKPSWLNRFVYEKVRCVKGRPYSINARTPRDFLNQLEGKAPDCQGKKQLFCLLADQDSRIPSATEGTFLGRPVKNNPLPDFLLRHHPETPVFFCWIEEREEKNIQRKILHAIHADTYREANGIDEKKSIIDGPYRRWLEERIAENPALWYGWTHRRFRSRNPEVYR